MMCRPVLNAMVFATVLPALLATGNAGIVEAQAKPSANEPKTVTVADGVVLHYTERGRGLPLILVHGSLADYSVWTRELADFSAQYRTISYSRRYNSPNTNSIRPGHSAIQDADDLAAFIKALNLGRVHVVGHSYRALTTLFLAIRHPDVLRTIVLAEPPAVPLLAHLPPDRAKAGLETLTDIETRVRQMRTAWRSGDREEGMRIFLTWQTGNPAFWERVLPEGARQALRRNFMEWDAVLLTGELFPSISPQAITAIAAPALVVSGADTTPYLATVADELTRLLQPRGATHVVIPQASHVMFTEQPVATHEAVLGFLTNAAAR
jgi:pimeloyl-ACP methyl ester carboxylesterase